MPKKNVDQIEVHDSEVRKQATQIAIRLLSVQSAVSSAALSLPDGELRDALADAVTVLRESRNDIVAAFEAAVAPLRADSMRVWQRQELLTTKFEKLRRDLRSEMRELKKASDAPTAA